MFGADAVRRLEDVLLHCVHGCSSSQPYFFARHCSQARAARGRLRFFSGPSAGAAGAGEDMFGGESGATGDGDLTAADSGRWSRLEGHDPAARRFGDSRRALRSGRQRDGGGGGGTRQSGEQATLWGDATENFEEKWRRRG